MTSERAVRELAKVEPGQRAGLVAAVVGSGKPVTAAAIKRHLPPYREKLLVIGGQGLHHEIRRDMALIGKCHQLVTSEGAARELPDDPRPAALQAGILRL